MKKRKQKNYFAEMCKGIVNFMEQEGWTVEVLNNPQVTQRFGSLKYNYYLTFDFTGRKKKEENK